MQKSIFGYQVREVDETLKELRSQNEMLISHNDSMEREVSSLRKQLTEAQAQISEGMTKNALDELNELRESCTLLKKSEAELALAVEQANREKELLQQKIALLEAQVKKLTMQAAEKN